MRLRSKGNLWTIGMNVTSTTTKENSMENPQKAKNRPTVWPTNSPPGYIYPENMKPVIWKYSCIAIFIALFTKANIWKQPNCPPTDE